MEGNFKLLRHSLKARGKYLRFVENLDIFLIKVYGSGKWKKAVELLFNSSIDCVQWYQNTVEEEDDI